MNTYWDNFIEVYAEYIPKVPLIEILEAFYHYTKDDVNKAHTIMSMANINRID